MVNKAIIFLPALLLAACKLSVTQDNSAAQKPDQSGGRPAASATADPFAFPTVQEPDGRAWQAPAILQAQVALDRRGFAPGILDGRPGQSFTAALRGFQAANGLPVTGRYDDRTAQALSDGDARPATWLVRIPAGFAQGPFAPLPKDYAEQAKLPSLGYTSLSEKLAERFHTTPEALAALNKGRTFAAGAVIRVPAIANQPVARIPGDGRGWGVTLATLGVAADQPRADHVVVDKSEGVLKVYGPQDKLIAQFPATMGSSHDPLPLGKWTIKGVSRNPPFHYNPALFWDADATDKKATLPPGPNGPVGVVWIDLSKPHYGIHGTPEPQTIGRSESHGCIRLSNWDAARLAQMVSSGTEALFQP
jgi:lipoprotein-anchoring transpeptidase ErfK/SrfK